MSSTSPHFVDPGLAEHTLTIAFGRNFRDTSPRCESLTLEALAQLFHRPDTGRSKLTFSAYHALEKKDQRAAKDGEYFMPVTFARNGTRSGEAISTIGAFVIDIDTGAISKSSLVDALHGLTYIGYSSFSHSAETPKWRAIIPFNTPIEPDQLNAVYRHFDLLLGGNLDPRCGVAAQIWYTPACPHDAVDQFEFFTGEGVLFDAFTSSIETLAATEVPTATTAQSYATTSTVAPHSAAELSRIEDALTAISADDRDVWIKVGLALKHDLGEIGREVWLKWSAKSTKFDADDASYNWQSFKPDFKGTPVTMGTVFHMAQGRGWTDPTGGEHPRVLALNTKYFVAPEGGKTVVFHEAHDPEFNCARLNRMAPESFKTLYMNQTILTFHNGKPKSTDIATAWLKSPARRTYKGICFLPGSEPPADFYNTWRGFAVVPKAGDWSKLREHMLHVLCAGRQVEFLYLLQWMAHTVQHQDRPGEVAVVMRGGRGTGKGTLANAFGKLFGSHFLQVTQARHLTGNFNAHLRDCTFLFVDEAFWAGDTSGENTLKALITEPMLPIERKGYDVVPARNRLHIMIASNNDWIIPAGAQERRYFVINASDEHAQDHAYFAAIREQLANGGLAALLDELMSMDLSGFNVRAVPKTIDLDEQVLRSLSPQHSWWMDKLNGCYTDDDWRLQSSTDLAASMADVLPRYMNMQQRGRQTALGMLLQKVTPGAKAIFKRDMWGKVSTYYEFPPLVECRAYFQKALGLTRPPWTVFESAEPSEPSEPFQMVKRAIVDLPPPNLSSVAKGSKDLPPATSGDRSDTKVSRRSTT